MNHDKGLLSGSITILIGCVIAIMALVRGPFQAWLLVIVFTLWGLWVVLTLLLPYMMQANRIQKRKKRERQLHSQGISQNMHSFQFPDFDEHISEDLLVRYANHRILTYLRSTYGNACFEWCEKHPAELIRKNGTGRIRLCNVDEFDHADITFHKDATIQCDLLKIVPLYKAENGQSDLSNIPPNKETIDPRIWYENNGRSILETLISDLDSRGHGKVTLKENGDICIHEANELIPQDHFSNFPAKVYWPRLIEVFENNGLTAETTTHGIQISW